VEVADAPLAAVLGMLRGHGLSPKPPPPRVASVRPPGAGYPFDDWAEIYDRVYADLTHDVPFYVQLALANAGPVLELGCGTGRVSLAMAEAGVNVLGIDISPLMAARANAKAAARGLGWRAAFQADDMRTLRLERTFGLVVMPFRSLQLVTTPSDQRAVLATAAAHLATGGTLAFDVFNPDPDLLADTGDEPFVDSIVVQPDGSVVIVHATNRWDHAEQLSHPHLWIEEHTREGVTLAVHEREFAMRYVHVGEMRDMLADAGFEVEAVYGGFDGEPVEDDCDDLAFVARRG